MQGAIWVTALAKLDEYVGFIGGGDKPMALFMTSLIRAKFCELLGEKLGDAFCRAG